METLIYQIHQPENNAEAIARAAQLIQNGALVAIPTETVYGLGANALDEEAVARIFEAKGRPGDNPLILHLPDAAWIARYCVDVPPIAYTLAEKFWPGPLTMILHRNPIVPDRTTGGLDTVGVRCPNHPVTLALISQAGVPIAAPSANRSGRPSCTTAAHVLEDMQGKIECILDGGDCLVGVESTILDLTVTPARLLRPGGLPLEQLREIVGEIELDDALKRALSADETPRAPGMKYRHYAPQAPVTVVTGSPAKSAQYIRSRLTPQDGVICYDEFRFFFDDVIAHPFGSLQNQAVQARRVFDALRRFDTTDVTHIYAQCPDANGLGLAIGNRLKKAAGFRVVDADALDFPARKFHLIGITGGTGAGKTTALRELAKLNVHIIDCDQVYHALLTGNERMQNELKTRFGADLFTPAGLDRKRLGEIVFRDSAAMADLNRITHYYINMETNRQIDDARAAGMAGAAIDAFLLLEGDMGARCEFHVGIIAPTEERVKRLIAREGITAEYARTRIAAQKSDRFYRDNCTYILENNATQAQFAQAAQALFRPLLQEETNHE